MLGNENDAALALAGSLELIGEGCTRRVYIDDARKVVYKVEHFDMAVHTANYDEIERSHIVTPHPIVVPTMHLFDNGVLAMEYVNGTMAGECYCLPNEVCDDTCMSEDILSVLRTISPDAGTWGNTVWKDGLLYLIDLGH